VVGIIGDGAIGTLEGILIVDASCEFEPFCVDTADDGMIVNIFVHARVG
jgi:hypothetical protein